MDNNLRVVLLDSDLEEVFFRLVEKDPLDYLFFVKGWMYDKANTEVYLALGDDDIKGSMLIYKRGIIHLRGESDAIHKLMEKLDVDQVIEGLIYQEHLPIFSSKYSLDSIHMMNMMLLLKGEEKLHIVHNVLPLESEYAKEIADLMRNIKPDWWGYITPETISNSIAKGALWFGVKANGRIVSVTSGKILFKLGRYVLAHVGIVATHERYRRMGYATSTLSKLLEKLLVNANIVSIYVLADNYPAIKLYEKLGFKHYRSYLFVKAKRK
ncbi:MAG: GNAT family N-acetyltransferase [Candidatus Bathyarchaeia archaeon]